MTGQMNYKDLDNVIGDARKAFKKQFGFEHSSSKVVEKITCELLEKELGFSNVKHLGGGKGKPDFTADGIEYGDVKKSQFDKELTLQNWPSAVSDTSKPKDISKCDKWDCLIHVVHKKYYATQLLGACVLNKEQIAKLKIKMQKKMQDKNDQVLKEGKGMNYIELTMTEILQEIPEKELIFYWPNQIDI